MPIVLVQMLPSVFMPLKLKQLPDPCRHTTAHNRNTMEHHSKATVVDTALFSSRTVNPGDPAGLQERQAAFGMDTADRTSPQASTVLHSFISQGTSWTGPPAGGCRAISHPTRAPKSRPMQSVARWASGRKRWGNIAEYDAHLTYSGGFAQWLYC
jgi:hypothetical protein